MASSRRWRRFMRFRIMSSPACSERCRCGISRGSAIMRVDQRGVGLDAVDGGEAQARQVRDEAQDALHEVAEGRLAGQVAPQLVRSTPVSTISA
jgi:hypothetical protein